MPLSRALQPGDWGSSVARGDAAGSWGRYLGRHVHEVVQDEGRGFRGAPAGPSEPPSGSHVPFPVLAVTLRAAGARAREQKPAVHQLDVVQPGQQVGEHDLSPAGVRRGEPLADL